MTAPALAAPSTRIVGTPALFRVNPSNGKPELQPRAFEALNEVPGWTEPTR
ncbi:MAG: hypothetical protein ABI321_08725 [Polyangia bacterium]